MSLLLEMLHIGKKYILPFSISFYGTRTFSSCVFDVLVIRK